MVFLILDGAIDVVGAIPCGCPWWLQDKIFIVFVGWASFFLPTAGPFQKMGPARKIDFTLFSIILD